MKTQACNSKGVASFIFEDIICRYGSIVKIVTDNGPKVKAAVKELLGHYGIQHIKISPYNLQANGVVKNGHFTIREAVKSRSVLHLQSFLIPLMFHISYSDNILTPYPFYDFLILCSVPVHP